MSNTRQIPLFQIPPNIPSSLPFLQFKHKAKKFVVKEKKELYRKLNNFHSRKLVPVEILKQKNGRGSFREKWKNKRRELVFQLHVSRLINAEDTTFAGINNLKTLLSPPIKKRWRQMRALFPTVFLGLINFVITKLQRAKCINDNGSKWHSRSRCKSSLNISRGYYAKQNTKSNKKHPANQLLIPLAPGNHEIARNFRGTPRRSILWARSWDAPKMKTNAKISFRIWLFPCSFYG